jgi:hypothetical protein
MSYHKDLENEWTSLRMSVNHGFEHTSLQSCLMGRHSRFLATLAGYLWNWIESYRLSKRKVNCLTSKTLARRNHALPLKIFLSQRRSVQVHWFWQWWSCRLFVFHLRSRLSLAERDRCNLYGRVVMNDIIILYCWDQPYWSIFQLIQ